MPGLLSYLLSSSANTKPETLILMGYLQELHANIEKMPEQHRALLLALLISRPGIYDAITELPDGLDTLFALLNSTKIDKPIQLKPISDEKCCVTLENITRELGIAYLAKCGKVSLLTSMDTLKKLASTNNGLCPITNRRITHFLPLRLCDDTSLQQVLTCTTDFSQQKEIKITKFLLPIHHLASCHTTSILTRFEDTCIAHLLTFSPSGRKLLKSHQVHQPEAFNKIMTAKTLALPEKTGPYQSATPLYNLMDWLGELGGGSELLKPWMETQYSSFFEAILKNPALTQPITGDGPNKGETPLHYLAGTRSGREILSYWLKTNPESFVKTMTAETLALPEEAGLYQGATPLYWLTAQKDGL